MPGAETSDKDFDNHFASNSNAMKDFMQDLKTENPRVIYTIPIQIAAIYEQLRELDWPAALKSYACGVLALYKCRLHDVFVREYCLCLYMALGENFIRSHGNRLYVWNDIVGFFDHFSGIMPECIFVVLKHWLLVVEGLFRSFTRDVQRSDQGIIKAITTAWQTCGRDIDKAEENWSAASVYNHGSQKYTQKGGEWKGSGKKGKKDGEPIADPLGADEGGGAGC